MCLVFFKPAMQFFWRFVAEYLLICLITHPGQPFRLQREIMDYPINVRLGEDLLEFVSIRPGYGRKAKRFR
ncbi:hypothetical protein D3C80_2094160 [compost metagenome]